MWYDKYEDIELLKELYRCHYTRHEMALLSGRSYGSIGSIVQGFMINNIKKYDRRRLSRWEGIYNVRATAA